MYIVACHWIFCISDYHVAPHSVSFLCMRSLLLGTKMPTVWQHFGFWAWCYAKLSNKLRFLLLIPFFMFQGCKKTEKSSSSVRLWTGSSFFLPFTSWSSRAWCLDVVCSVDNLCPSRQASWRDVVSTPGPLAKFVQWSHSSNSMITLDFAFAIRIIMTCMVMMTIYITSMEAREAHIAHRKKLKRRDDDDVSITPHCTLGRHEHEEVALEHPHVKQIFYLIAWHIGVIDAKWYVKPRLTYWFEEYFFNIYTRDVFCDILRMRRRTFDMLVHDLWPFIQGQYTHWR